MILHTDAEQDRTLMQLFECRAPDLHVATSCAKRMQAADVLCVCARVSVSCEVFLCCISGVRALDLEHRNPR